MFGVVVVPDFQNNTTNLGTALLQKLLDVIAINGLSAIQSEDAADRRCPPQAPPADTTAGWPQANLGQ